MAYSYYKLNRDDLIYSRVKVHPKNSFWFYSGSVYHNKDVGLSGSFANPIKHLPGSSGSISLYEINIDRPSSSMVSSSLPKGSSLEKYKTVSTGSWATTEHGTEFVREYPFTASVSIEPVYDSTASIGYSWEDWTATSSPVVSGSRQLQALRNTLNSYTHLSPHYSFKYSVGDTEWDKEKQGMSLIKIPSVFYGSKIKKGTVRLRYYQTGTLAAELNDRGHNGELVQTYQAGTTGTGSVAGVVLYNEGFILLTGSWNFTDDNCSAPYLPLPDGTAVHSAPAWRYFGFTGSHGASVHSVASASSFHLSFEGQNFISTMAMNVRAPMGELNYSNNLTAIEYSEVSGNFTTPESTLMTADIFQQSDTMKIKAVNKSAHDYHSASYKSTTYISKVGIYDEYHNLIAIAKMATPVRKRENDDLTFRLKLDI